MISPHPFSVGTNYTIDEPNGWDRDKSESKYNKSKKSQRQGKKCWVSEAYSLLIKHWYRFGTSYRPILKAKVLVSGLKKSDGCIPNSANCRRRCWLTVNKTIQLTLGSARCPDCRKNINKNRCYLFWSYLALALESQLALASQLLIFKGPLCKIGHFFAVFLVWHALFSTHRPLQLRSRYFTTVS